MEKSGVSSFLSNLWYYHKWKILFGAFLLLFVAVSASRCIDKSEPDLSILYVGDMDIGDACRRSMEEDCGGFFDDIDGDGKKTLAVTFMGENDPDTKSRLQTEVLAGDHSVFFVDKGTFGWLLQHGVLAPLEDIVGAKPEHALDDCGIELKYLDIAETKGFSAMPGNTVVCIRGNAKGDIDYGQSDELYKNSVGFLAKLLSYRDSGVVREDISLVLIGDRDLNGRCVDTIEQSLCDICRLSGMDTVPVLVYDSMQLKYDDAHKFGDGEHLFGDGEHLFGDGEKQAAKELADGDKLLLLDADAFEYLASEGLLFDIGGLSCALPESAEKYGVPLTSLPLFKAEGFRYADDPSHGRIYLCASVGAGDCTRQVLGILYDFKSDGSGGE